jgi:hypothetical protein
MMKSSLGNSTFTVNVNDWSIPYKRERTSEIWRPFLCSRREHVVIIWIV